MLCIIFASPDRNGFSQMAPPLRRMREAPRTCSGKGPVSLEWADDAAHFAREIFWLLIHYEQKEENSALLSSAVLRANPSRLAVERVARISAAIWAASSILSIF